MIRWLKGILNVCMLVGLVFLLSFTEQRQENLACKAVSIHLDKEATSFINRGEVLLILNSLVDSIEGLPLSQLPLYEIEQTIEQHALVAVAEAYVLPDGSFNVSLTQKEPIVRVKNISDKEFYLTDAGKPFPLSRNYTQRVLVANGHVEDSTDIAMVTRVAAFIENDTFWKAQITQIYMNESKEIELIPRVGNHTILLGSVELLEKKMEKLMLFYTKGVSQTGWNNYQLINLKYKNQIVCVKR